MHILCLVSCVTPGFRVAPPVLQLGVGPILQGGLPISQLSPRREEGERKLGPTLKEGLQTRLVSVKENRR